MAELEDHPNQSGQEPDAVPGQGVEAAVTSEHERPPVLDFPVAALGASAGGLEAFKLILENLPLDTGMAFVLIQHLSPQHSSQLSSLLSHSTSMPVTEVADPTPVQPNQVFVIPPNKLMSISQGVLKLTPRPESAGVPMPINHFFRSLAKDQKSGSIAVVLSGTDSDGALGLQNIREEGGIAIAQSEDSAKFPGMPHNAAGAGPVDLILSPKEIAHELGRIAGTKGPARFAPGGATGPPVGEPPSGRHYDAILALLKESTGIDFRGYKRQTIDRRIRRQMLLHRHAELAEYAARLETNRSELTALYEDILINVTSFFRDPGAFVALGNELLPELLKSWVNGSPLRVWIPGCSTGEEVYSIAMCLLEAVSQIPSPVPIQFFGTDISERALAAARLAVYQENQLAELSEERRRRFFAPIQNGFQVVKPVRELCIFARQNVCVDPPFSRMNLISCRNLLIYLGPGLQRQVIATFHYALQPEGYLMLGKSETLNGFPQLFSQIDKEHKFFQRTGGAHASLNMIGRGFTDDLGAARPHSKAVPNRPRRVDFERAAERIVLREHGPAWVVVNDRFEIVHSRGPTSDFLQLPAGVPSFDLMRMARESLRSELQKLLARARDHDLAFQASTVREIGDGKIQRIGLEVRSIPGQTRENPRFLVIFSSPKDHPAQSEESGPRPDLIRSAPGSQTPEVEGLREELTLTGQRLQTLIDEHDAANQELTSANEEISSSNEELQSINEELETAKEELQSSNEELSTLNQELQNRNAELSRVGDDLANLMSSTTIPILLLDNFLRIRRMTPVAESALGIRPGDLGRPLSEIRMRLSVEDVESLARGVLTTLSPRKVELRDREGRWCELRLRPYRTADNRIGGVVMVLIDIDQLRRAQEESSQARQFAESIVQAVQTPLLALGKDLRIRMANRAFYDGYGIEPAEVENMSFLEIRQGEWNFPELRAALEGTMEDRAAAGEVELEGEFGGQGKKNVCIHLRSVQPDGEKLILAALEDITAQKQAANVLAVRQEQLKSRVEEGTAALRESESALLRSRGELRGLAASLLNAQESERRRISRELHDDLSQKVAKLQFDIETLEQKLPLADVRDAKQTLLRVRDQAAMLAGDLRRVAHGLHPSSLDHLGLAVALRSYAEEFSQSTAIPVQFTSYDIPAQIPIEVSTCLYRIVQEGLRNVGKHAPSAAVEITLAGNPDMLDLSIRDDGEAFDAEVVREKRGLGFISMQERVRLVQGEFSLEAKPGRGVHISVQVPLAREGPNAA